MLVYHFSIHIMDEKEAAVLLNKITEHKTGTEFRVSDLSRSDQKIIADILQSINWSNLTGNSFINTDRIKELSESIHDGKYPASLTISVNKIEISKDDVNMDIEIYTD